MADEHPSGPPRAEPPAGMQRPGIPGAGNILDPAVRADIREQLQAAVQELMQRARGQETSEPARPTAEAPAAGTYRSGPYPHGDVDLRSIGANVPAEPIRPQRRGSGRRFYFLNEAAAPAAQAGPLEVSPPAGPKPG